MRSLRLKLIITFLVISLAGILLTTLIVRFSNERAFNTLLRVQDQAAFINSAQAYYESNGSWQGIEQALSLRITPEAAGQPPDLPPPFALADENGRTVLPALRVQPSSKRITGSTPAGPPWNTRRMVCKYLRS